MCLRGPWVNVPQDLGSKDVVVWQEDELSLSFSSRVPAASANADATAHQGANASRTGMLPQQDGETCHVCNQANPQERPAKRKKTMTANNTAGEDTFWWDQATVRLAILFKALRGTHQS